MLDNHVSVQQILSIRSLIKWQYINYMCFKVQRAVFQGPWSGEGVVWEWGVVELAISSDGFLNMYVIDIHDILTFQVSGDTRPVAFYLECFRQ